MFYSPPRSTGTSILCPECKENLDIRRTCHEVYMACPSCKKQYPVQSFIPQMDTAMELFLEQQYSDRI